MCKFCEPRYGKFVGHQIIDTWGESLTDCPKELREALELGDWRIKTLIKGGKGARKWTPILAYKRGSRLIGQLDIYYCPCCGRKLIKSVKKEET